MYYILSFLLIPEDSRVFTSFDEVCFSSFSYTAFIRFNEWSLLRRCSETVASRNLFVDSLLAGKHFFISVLKLSCPCTAATKMENNYYQVSSSECFFNWIVDLVFRWGKCRKRIHRWLRLCHFMQAITEDYRKNLLSFQIFNYSCSSTAATKWNTAAIKLLPLFEDGLFIWFLGWG